MQILYCCYVLYYSILTFCISGILLTVIYFMLPKMRVACVVNNWGLCLKLQDWILYNWQFCYELLYIETGHWNGFVPLLKHFLITLITHVFYFTMHSIYIFSRSVYEKSKHWSKRLHRSILLTFTLAAEVQKVGIFCNLWKTLRISLTEMSAGIYGNYLTDNLLWSLVVWHCNDISTVYERYCFDVFRQAMGTEKKTL